jgi:hypothetical protein
MTVVEIILGCLVWANDGSPISKIPGLVFVVAACARIRLERGLAKAELNAFGPKNRMKGIRNGTSWRMTINVESLG